MFIINNIINSIINNINNILFVFNISCMFFYEYMLFLYNKNWKIFIKSVTYKLAKKNILYVKIFQSISLNNDLIDNCTNTELLKYTDSVPYDADEINWNSLLNLKNKYNLEFLDILPINSGMISLVYKMKNMDTDEIVIVKIKRNNIDIKLNDAINKLLFCVYILSFIPQLNILDLNTTIKNNINNFKDQLNFESEVQNTIEMYDSCKDLKYIKIPYIYPEVTTLFPNIIMMEYIVGNHISNIKEEDYEIYAELILKYGFVSLLKNNVTHGDLHAGNILFIKNECIPKYQIGLIDFGIVTKLDLETKNAMFKLAPLLFSKSGKYIAEQIIFIGIEPKHILSELSSDKLTELFEITGKIIDEALCISKKGTQIKIYEFVNSFNNYLIIHDLKKYGLRLTDDFFKCQMSVAMSHGLSMSLCKGDYMIFANRILSELFHTNLLIDSDSDSESE